MNVYGLITGTIHNNGSISAKINSAQSISGDVIIPAFVGPETYEGDYVVTPRLVEQVLETANKSMRDDVTVNQIPILRATNPYGGDTILIG